VLSVSCLSGVENSIGHGCALIAAEEKKRVSARRAVNAMRCMQEAAFSSVSLARRTTSIRRQRAYSLLQARSGVRNARAAYAFAANALAVCCTAAEIADGGATSYMRRRRSCVLAACPGDEICSATAAPGRGAPECMLRAAALLPGIAIICRQHIVLGGHRRVLMAYHGAVCCSERVTRKRTCLSSFHISLSACFAFAYLHNTVNVLRLFFG